MNRLGGKRSPVLLLLLVLAAALTLGACGESDSKVTTGTYAGESGANAPYLNVGPLVYQVQISRQLNPANAEDQAYLRGLTPAQKALEPGEEWFAVFMQVWNHTSVPHPAAAGIQIYDAAGNVYDPLTPGPDNEFAYRGGILRPEGRIPEPGTTASNGGTQGAVLLYKLKVVSLENRPIKVKIANPLDFTETATAELDV
jgi:hypothetical protein